MDVLWKKAVTGMYTDLFKETDTREVSAKIEMGSILGREYNKKNNEKSTQLRQLGNMKVNEKNWYEAMVFYNKSLLFAEIDSENVSFAIANRSTCFLKLDMFQECLEDIELAINAKYPERLMPKLDQRRKVCLEQMNNNNSQPMKVIEPKLDFDADVNFPGMSNVIKMEYNEKFGRHFNAKCDLEVGKVVMVEEAFVTTTKWNQHTNICDACFKSMANFIACPHCTSALFCNQTCAYDILHKIRCGRSSEIVDDKLVEFVLRSIVVAMNIFTNVGALIEFVEDVIGEIQKEVPHAVNDMQSKYRLFLKLNLWVTTEHYAFYIQRGYQVFQFIMKSPIYRNSFSGERSKRFLMHLCVMHTAIVECNSFQTAAHGGIFLLRNHFNHSCAPNTLTSNYSNKTAIITSRRIKKGDQLFISYGGHYFYEPLHKRQQDLFENFGFHCECEKCKNGNWPISSARIKSDPIFQMVLNDEKQLKRRADEIPTFNFLKKKCVEILTKYSDSFWCMELDKVSHLYQDLSIETLF